MPKYRIVAERSEIYEVEAETAQGAEAAYMDGAAVSVHEETHNLTVEEIDADEED